MASPAPNPHRSIPRKPPVDPDIVLLDCFQARAFQYFLETVNRENGLVADTTRPGYPSSIAVVGFALTCYPVGVSRGWMTHADAAALTLTTLRFFRDSTQNDTPRATGYKGFYYHFLDMRTGERVWQSELSMIDSALPVRRIPDCRHVFRGQFAGGARDPGPG